MLEFATKCEKTAISAVDIPQLAHTVNECILCREGYRCTLSKRLWGELVDAMTDQ